MRAENIGILSTGMYLPKSVMTAAEISKATNGVWSEEAVKEKLGIVQKRLPGKEDGTQEMGAKAAAECVKKAGIDPKEIDLILCIGEEWKEFPLTTSARYIQDKVGSEIALDRKSVV